MAVYFGWNNQGAAALLSLPKLTDVRMPGVGSNGDLVEVPSGSGLYWGTQAVLDVAKGFTNEYRMAVIFSYNLTVGGWQFPQP